MALRAKRVLRYNWLHEDSFKRSARQTQKPGWQRCYSAKGVTSWKTFAGIWRRNPFLQEMKDARDE
jgi:hypothetical protein